jgi:hypothetical protein
MIDMYRRPNFFPRWIMATSLGRTNRYVPSSILQPISTIYSSRLLIETRSYADS